MTLRTLVKICGITTEEDGLAVGRLGADFLGFIFYPPSPRYVEPERAAHIVETVRRQMGVKAPRAIGVFVDAAAKHVAEVRSLVELDGVQFSGDESPDYLARQLPIRFRGLSLQTLERLDNCEAEAYLCDAHAPETKGGTGKAYDYSQLAPHIERRSIIIAGGLDADTVGDVVRSLHPWGVDASSRLEVEPGRKNLDHVRRFIRAVRAAGSDAGS